MKTPSPYRSYVASASRLLDFANQFIVRELNALGIYDIHPAHGDILVQLYTEDGLTVRELAQKTQRSKSTVSVLVDRLCENGYLVKWRLPNDQRTITVRLTDKAGELKPLFDRVSQTLNDRLTEALTDDEADTLEALLERITHSLEARK